MVGPIVSARLSTVNDLVRYIFEADSYADCFSLSNAAYHRVFVPDVRDGTGEMLVKGLFR